LRVPVRRLPGRKLLVASIGVAAVSYVGCSGNDVTVTNFVDGGPVREDANIPLRDAGGDVADGPIQDVEASSSDVRVEDANTD
jgi:hypothetical protein